MTPVLKTLPLIALLAACTGDETLTAYGVSGAYRLSSLSGGTAPRATISFPEPGLVAGEAPCNAYSGRQTAPYPWFKIEDISATRLACDALDQETRFFDALRSMTEAETLGTTLILRNTEGGEMVFTQINATSR
ncbi:MAG: META domain-containing protein [Rhodobacterales bacterium]|nr:MAG: META domain-containing protein [Rhodobacterales bacterium]